MNCVSIGSGNGLLPVRYQTITWTNADFFVNWTYRNKLQWNSNQNTTLFINENAFENVVCEMAAILYKGRWVKEACVLN